MKISIGADHRGLSLKNNIIEHFQEHEWLDVGTYNEQRTDYPIFARRVCEDIINQTAEAGLLICGSGVGASIAANRFRGIYAALAWNQEVAAVAKEHDRANVLVLPADFVTVAEAFAIVEAWLLAEFKEGIYQRRLEMIDE